MNEQETVAVVDDGNCNSPNIRDCDNEEELKNRRKRIIEAILFAAGHSLEYKKIAEVLEVTPSEARSLCREYASEYNKSNDCIPRGIMMLTMDDSAQLCTAEEYGSYVRTALDIKRGGNLSQSSLEVLAVVAYNQPVTRVFIDSVRGVDSSYAVTSLTEKQLIEICGRLEVPGRPLLYRTTDNFLRIFGLESLEELPSVNPS